MNIGLITFHAGYNFGAVLQAYATQCVIRELCGDVEIINYRMNEQRNFYSLYRTKYGLKTLLKDLMQLPVHGKRKIRSQRFEDFFIKYMHLSKECKTPEEISKLWSKYDVIVSGSDQMWNKHSCELEHNSWRYMEPYLLKGYKGKKVSYASSTANMTDSELNKIKFELLDFQHIAMREKSSAIHIGELIGREIKSVLDPTFLLTKEQWIQNLDLVKEVKEEYILYYSLRGIKDIPEDIKKLEKIAKRLSCKVKIVTPFIYWPIHGDVIEIHPEYGPIEFLQAIYNAKIVISDSYHGTILPINFHKEIYSICKGEQHEIRKTDVLYKLGLKNRIISNVSELENKEITPIDYASVDIKIDGLRKESIRYLKKALGGVN